MPVSRKFESTSRNGTWLSLSKENMVRLLDLESANLALKRDLLHYNVVFSTNGGLIAAYRRQLPGKNNSIYLLSSDGAPNQPCSSIPLGSGESVSFMCWNNYEDHLIVVTGHGHVHFYKYNGEAATSSLSIEEAHLFTSTENGFVALSMGSEDVSLLAVQCVEGNEYRAQSVVLPSVFRRCMVNTTLAVIPHRLSNIGCIEVFLTCADPGKTLDSSVYYCTFGAVPRCVDKKVTIEGSGVRAMALSPSGDAIAFFTEDGTLFSTNKSFEEVVRLHRVEDGTWGTQLSWCGDRCICYIQSSTAASSLDDSLSLYIVDAQDSERFDLISDLPRDVILVQEADGVRLVSKHSYQFLQAVPTEARRVFSVGSRAPGAILLSTFDYFMGGHAEAVRMIQNMQSNGSSLVEAIRDCVMTAGFEFDIAQQKRLLRIAGFGKSFYPLYDSNEFVDMARRIRIRNTLRTGAGFLISDAEMHALGDYHLQKRLIGSHYFQMALAVAEAMDLRYDDVLVGWARAKLESASNSLLSIEDEDKLAEILLKKMRHLNSAPFVRIAEFASRSKRQRVAIALLGAEPSVDNRIAALLNIKEPGLALTAAAELGDSDLVFTVISHMMRNGHPETFSSIITAQAIPRQQLLQYAAMCDRVRPFIEEYLASHRRIRVYMGVLRYLAEETHLRTLLADSRGERGRPGAVPAWTNSAVLSALASIKKELESVTASVAPVPASLVTAGPGAHPTPSASYAHLRLHTSLLDTQAGLARDLNDVRFLTASVADTVQLSLEHGSITAAQHVKTQFNVPEKMYQWCMLKAYASTGKWELIDQMGSGGPKPRIALGGEAFVTTLLSQNRPQQAKKYIPRIPQLVERLEFYVQCGEWADAAADCRGHNDTDLLQQLRERAKGNAQVLQQIDDGWKRRNDVGGLNFTKLFS